MEIKYQLIAIKGENKLQDFAELYWGSQGDYDNQYPMGITVVGTELSDDVINNLKQEIEQLIANRYTATDRIEIARIVTQLHLIPNKVMGLFR